MITVGIDLAYRDPETALCAIEWPVGSPPTVRTLTKNVSDDSILTWAERADCVAIDAPMGWPRDFVDFIARHAAGEAVGPAEQSGQSLWLRRTDHLMPNNPLSVAADKLAKPAARCAHLQTELRARGIEVDRAGLSGRVIEVYPAAALRTWDFTAAYKKASGAAKQAERRAAREAIARYLVGPLRVTGVSIDELIETDDHLDAFICALLARAARCGQIANLPEGDDLQAARVEGWIHLPTTHAVDRLL